MKTTFDARKVTLISIMILAFVTFMLPANAAQTESDKLVQPTDDGGVIGRIYDATNMSPIVGATVVIQEDGAFASSGKTIGKTDAIGGYECKAKIGRISGHLNVAQALFSSPLGLLTGAARDKTKRTDISRLNIRVTADGFQPFEGIVPCRRIIADEFVAAMEPIMLVKTDSTEVSTVAIGWGNMEITSASVEPTILHPKWKATVAVSLKCPAQDPKLKPVIVIYSALCGKKQLTKFTTEADGSLLFRAEWAVPSRAGGIDLMRILVQNTPYELKPINDTILMQVTKAEEAAKLRLKAFELRKKCLYEEALKVLTELCSMPEAIDYDKDTLFSVQNCLPLSQPLTPAEVAPPQGSDLDSLLASAKKQTDVDTKFQDFNAWHQYALLLFRQAHYKGQQNSAELLTSIEECRNALIGALRSGRSAMTYKNTNLSFGARRIESVSGFQVPEADSDFVLLQNINVLRTPVVDYLDYLNVATALCDLSQMDLTATYADKCLSVKGDCIEAKYVKALADIQEGNARNGVSLLQDVVKANPRHYRANLVLAKAYTEAGETEKAASYLSAHEAFYGSDAKQLLCSIKLLLQGIDLAEKKPEPPVIILAKDSDVPLTPVEPVITKGPKYLKENGFALVPLKSIGEWIGATIDFDKKSGIITLKSESNTVSLKLKSDVASVNSKLVQLSTPATERNGTTYVPLRFVGEAFAAKIKLDVSTGDIRIEHPSRAAVLVLSK